MTTKTEEQAGQQQEEPKQEEPKKELKKQEEPKQEIQEIVPTALGLPEGLIDDPAVIRDSISHLMNQGVNLLAPLARIQFIPPNYQAAFRSVLFPLEGQWIRKGGKQSNGLWYEVDRGQLALLKVSLRQLAAAANISWTTEDLSKQTNRWVVKATAYMRTMDGSSRSLTNTKDLDLRDDGSLVQSWQAQAKKKGRNADARILKAREFGNRMAESKAINAVIRDMLGIKATYSPEEAARPFVFPYLVYIPESADAKRMQAAQALGIVDQIYGPTSQGRVLADPSSIVDVESEEIEADPEKMSVGDVSEGGYAPGNPDWE